MSFDINLPQVIESVEVPATLWQEIEAEIAAIRPKLEDDTLSPEDVKGVQAFYRKVENSKKNFNKAMTTMGKIYRSELDKRLVQIGYPDIAKYITDKQMAEKNAVNARITYKAERMKDIVDNAIESTTYLKHSDLAPHVLSFVHPLFPRVSSGSKSSELSELAWQEIGQVINNMMTKIDQTMNPIMARLPISSATMRCFIHYLKSADMQFMQGLPSATNEDQPLYIRIILADKLQTENDVLEQISDVIALPTEDKLNHIKTIISVWDAKNF